MNLQVDFAGPKNGAYTLVFFLQPSVSDAMAARMIGSSVFGVHSEINRLKSCSSGG